MNRKHALMLGTAGLSMLLAAPLAFAQVPVVPGGKHIMILCGNENNTVRDCTSIDDITLKNRLELLMGHRVTMISTAAGHPALLELANQVDLVIVPESPGSAAIGTSISSTTTPILSSESFLQDELGFIEAPLNPVDPGYPGGPTATQLMDAIGLLTAAGIEVVIDVPTAPPIPPGATPEQIAAAEDAAEDAYDAALLAAADAAVANSTPPSHGVTVGQLDLVIVNPEHPLAAGFTGSVRVYRYPREMNWGVQLAPGAEIVATLSAPNEAAGDAVARTPANYRGANVIYTVPKGGELADGSASPGLRIHFFVENENGQGTYNLMTEDGFKLFDNAINWALAQGK